MAATIKKRVPLGDGVELLIGEYTHTAAGASETLTVSCGVVHDVRVSPRDAAGSPVDANPNLVSTSTSGALTTITFLQSGAVAAGKFVAIVGS